MTVNKDEIRRLDADKLLEWIRSNRSFAQSMMDTAVNERMKRLASEIESGTFDAPPDSKDAEIERLRKANELERRMYHELRAEWQKSEEARKAAEQHAVELAKQVLAAEQVAKAAAETAWGLDKERVELQQQLAELKKKVETYAAKNATLENDNRYLQEQHRLAAELATEQRYAKEQAIKWNDESVRLRQQNAELREVLKWYADEKTYRLGVKITMGTAHPMHEPIKSDKGERARAILDRYKDVRSYECSRCEDIGRLVRYGRKEEGEPHLVRSYCTCSKGDAAKLKDGQPADVKEMNTNDSKHMGIAVCENQHR